MYATSSFSSRPASFSHKPILGASPAQCFWRPCRQRFRAVKARSSEEKGQGSNGNVYSKVYERKATWEGTFGVEFDDEMASPASAKQIISSKPPWEAIGQLNEANLVWNNDLRARLLKNVIQNELGLSDEEIEKRMAELQILLPDTVAKLPSMKASIVAALVSDTNQVAKRLLKLKEIFPAANVSRLASRFPALVTADDQLGDLASRAAKLRAELPDGTNVDALVSSYPVEVLNVPSFLDAIKEARRLVPSLDISYTLANNPTQIFSFQKGDALIPYDDPRGEIN